MSEQRQTTTGGRAATEGVIPGRFALSVGKPNLPTPPGWSWVKLTDVARLETGHTPSRKHPEYWDGEISWVGIKDATSNHGRVINDTIQHVTQLGIENSSARILPANTVCLSRTASVGYVIVMGKPMATSQDFVNWVCSEEIDYRYLAAILFAENSSFSLFSRGTTHQTIYFPEAKAFHVLLPPIEEQRKLVDIIWSLNEKIELNRQINQTLEHIAQAIFKSWFVDFEPVKAKIQAKQNGQDPERATMCAISSKTDAELDAFLEASTPEQRQQLTATAVLFPDELEDSDLGPIPKGWEVSSIGNEFDVTMGQSPPGDTYNEECDGMPFFQGRRDFGWRYPANRVYCTAPKRLAKEGDTLLSVRAPVGDVNKSTSDCCIGRGVSALRHKSGCDAYTYYSMQRLEHLFINFDSEGTVFGSINQKDLKALKIVRPVNGVLTAFTKLVGCLDDEIRILEKQTNSLSLIRDSLLPKLLSGDVSPSDDATSKGKEFSYG